MREAARIIVYGNKSNFLSQLHKGGVIQFKKFCCGFSITVAGTDNTQCKHLGQAMRDAFDAYSNKSSLIRDEQMHLNEHETATY